MHNEYNFTLTPKANAAAKAAWLSSESFTMDSEMPRFAAGDLFSTEATMPLVFVITRRHFHFVTTDHLQVDLLLDLPAE